MLNEWSSKLYTLAFCASRMSKPPDSTARHVVQDLVGQCIATYTYVPCWPVFVHFVFDNKTKGVLHANEKVTVSTQI